VDIARLDRTRVSAEAVAALGLDATSLDVTSLEVLSESLRRAASFMCPTTPRRLVDVVSDVLHGLHDDDEAVRDQLETLLDAMIGYGDLLDLPFNEGSVTRRQVFLGPPAYVRRASDAFLLSGVRADGAPLIGDELLESVEYENHVRFIRSPLGESIDELLTSNGLTELKPEQWLQTPRRCSPEDLVSSCVAHLEAAGPAGEIDGIRVIDSSTRVSYYQGRWRSLKAIDNGYFVARRPQAFGADCWCFTRIGSGQLTQLIDLPVQAPLAPGADEGWRLQAALDSLAGHPQYIRTQPAARSGWSVVDFFSPIPSWAQRRLDVIGTPLLKSSGALFSYRLPDDEVEEELRFLEQMLWVLPENVPQGSANDR
jgi:hypothetical protein